MSNTFTAYEVGRKNKYHFGDKPNPFVLYVREAKQHGERAKAVESNGYHASILPQCRIHLTKEKAHAVTTEKLHARIASLQSELRKAIQDLADLPSVEALEVVETKLPTK